MRFVAHLFIWIIFLASLEAKVSRINIQNFEPLVLELKKITIPGANAINPSIVPYKEGYLLAYRNQGPRYVSTLGTVFLSSNFERIGEGHHLNIPPSIDTPINNPEDPRLVQVNGEIYIVFNDLGKEQGAEGKYYRRKIFISKLTEKDGQMEAGQPLQLRDLETHREHREEKNWVPFDYHNQLLMSYSINPHKVLQIPLDHGLSPKIAETTAPIRWDLYSKTAPFPLRGGTTALLVDGQYLAFFHSMCYGISNLQMHSVPHYFTGAYTFEAQPPFRLTAVSPHPFGGKGFYKKPSYRAGKVVTFPGGFVVDPPYIYLAYGCNDESIYIAKLNKNRLLSSLRSLNIK